jgi:glycosylphosphatidylinositol transamidase (GPIT) subunit GPI8
MSFLQEDIQNFNDRVVRDGEYEGHTVYVDYVNYMTNSELLDRLLGYGWSEDVRDKKKWKDE